MGSSDELCRGEDNVFGEPANSQPWVQLERRVCDLEATLRGEGSGSDKGQEVKWKLETQKINERLAVRDEI